MTHVEECAGTLGKFRLILYHNLSLQTRPTRPSWVDLKPGCSLLCWNQRKEEPTYLELTVPSNTVVLQSMMRRCRKEGIEPSMQGISQTQNNGGRNGQRGAFEHLHASDWPYSYVPSLYVTGIKVREKD